MMTRHALPACGEVSTISKHNRFLFVRECLEHSVLVVTSDDLPKPGSFKRWNKNKVALLLEAVKHGHISEERVMRDYSISEEEYKSWRERHVFFGRDGLKIDSLRKFELEVEQLLDREYGPVYKPALQVGAIVYDPNTDVLKVADLPVSLPRRLRDALCFLMQNAGTPVAYEHMHSTITKRRTDLTTKDVELSIDKIAAVLRDRFKRNPIERFGERETKAYVLHPKLAQPVPMVSEAA